MRKEYTQIKQENERLKAENAILREALKPFAEFQRAFDEKPISNLDPEEIYSIHGGDQSPPYGRSLKWSDCRRALELLNVTVVHEPTRKIMLSCGTVKAAEDWIAARMKVDPAGVARGDYGIDAPEEKVNPCKDRSRKTAKPR